MFLFLEKKQDWNVQFRGFAVTGKFPSEGKCFPIGTFKFVKELKEKYPSVVETDDLDLFKWSVYARLIGDDLLNADYSILPASEIKRLKFQTLARFGDDCKIFVRPDRGDKPFDGQILDITEIDYFSSMYDGELTVVSKPKKILGEWRFAVSNDAKVLGFSLYKYQENIVYIEACPPESITFVEKVAKKICSKFPHGFVVDIAQLHDMSFKVLECNSLHHSGLYAMKPEHVIEFINNLK